MAATHAPRGRCGSRVGAQMSRDTSPGLAYMKRQIRSLSGQIRLEVQRSRSVPFGVRWEHDVRSLMRSPTKRPTFIDVGANVGQTAAKLVQAFPNSTIYSF